MNEDKKTQEFGPNGAVLNSDTMSEPLRQAYLREQAKSNGWRKAITLKAIILFVLLLIASQVASEIIGFENSFAVLIALCVVMMLYQRFVKRRSWDSILWGLESPKDR